MMSRCFFLDRLYEALGMYEKIPSGQGTADAGLIRLLLPCGSAPWSPRAKSCPSSVPQTHRLWFGVLSKPELCGSRGSGTGTRPCSGGHATVLLLPRETAGRKHNKLLGASEESDPNQDLVCSCKGTADGPESSQK